MAKDLADRDQPGAVAQQLAGQGVAQAMRPQLGSWPYTAALTREEATTDFEIVRAASSLGAPDTRTSMRQVAPSPSHAIDFAKPCSYSPTPARSEKLSPK